ncbi:MAG: enoyl-CoA hydratase/isomerase family protein, partial [Candidatus Lokiarchaeota archaeon]|nr:enoyl-CoA hydratase/isomerase family protein [Candidatus Lokiarchaeota archaeon]
MVVLIEKNYPVFTIIINSPESKNAVDGPTAQELSSAFRKFESDEKALVAVLWGANGTFCSGANLKAITEGRGNEVEKKGDG